MLFVNFVTGIILLPGGGVKPRLRDQPGICGDHQEFVKSAWT